MRQDLKRKVQHEDKVSVDHIWVDDKNHMNEWFCPERTGRVRREKDLRAEC